MFCLHVALPQKRLWEEGSCDVAIIVAASAKDLEYLEKHPTRVQTILFNRELGVFLRFD